MKQKAFGVIQSYYKHSPVYGGVFYACFFSMHTRIDIVLCGQQSEEEFLLVVDRQNKDYRVKKKGRNDRAPSHSGCSEREC